MRYRVRRSFATLLALLTCWPALAFGQAPRAGVVTALEGSVTATRVALPQPVPLKFKDDVFLDDRIVTGDRSLARMLLGGKAVVTVRERSTLTVTEVPGRSTIEMDSGKIALAVAREKLRPGESIEIRTPNAVAGVRGTVVIAEVSRASVQAIQAAPAVVTTFYVLRGTITAVNLSPQTGAPIGPPVPVGVGQNFQAVGVQTPTVQPNPPVQQIVSGLQTSTPQHTQASNQEQVTQQQVQTTVALAQQLGLAPTTDTATTTTTSPTLTGGEPAPTGATSPATSPAAPILPGGSSTITQLVTVTGPTPLITLTDVDLTPAGLGAIAAEMVQVTAGLTNQVTTNVLAAPFVLASGPSPTISGPLGGPTVRMTGSSVTATGAGALFSVAGTDALATTLLEATGIFPGRPWTLDSSRMLLSLASSISMASALTLGTGAMASFGGDVVGFSSGTLTTTGNLVTVGAGAGLTLGGLLLNLPGGTPAATVGGDVVNVAGTLASTTGAPLLGIGAGSLAVTGDLVDLLAGSALSLNGPVLSVSGAGVTASAATGLRSLNPSAVTFGGTELFFVAAGAGFTASGPLLDLSGTALDLGVGKLALVDGTLAQSVGPPVRVSGGSVTTTGALFATGGPGSAINLTGSLELLNAAVTLGTVLNIPGGSTFTHTLAPGEPFLRMTNSTLALTGPGAFTLGSPLARLEGAQPAAAPSLSLTGQTITLTGANDLLTLAGGATLTQPALKLTGGSLTLGTGGLLRSLGAVTKTGAAPLIHLDPVIVNTGGDLVIVPGGTSLSLGGSLLVDVAANDIVAGGNLVNVGGTVTLAAGASFLDFTNSTVTAGTAAADTSLLRVTGTIDLGGALLVSTGSVTLAQQGQALVKVAFGGRLTTTATQTLPLIDLSNGTLFWNGVRAALIQGAGSAATLAGPFFRLADAVATGWAGPLVEVAGGGSFTVGGPFLDLTGLGFVTLTGQPVATLAGGTLRNTAGAAVRLGANTYLTADTLLTVTGSGNVVNTAGILDLTAASVTLRALVDDSAATSVQYLSSRALNQPAIRLTGTTAVATLTLTGAGETLLTLGDNALGSLPSELGIAVRSGSAGPLNAISIMGPLLALEKAAYGATDPLINLAQTSVSQGGPVLPFIEADPGGATATMVGPLFRSTGPATTFVSPGPFFHLSNGGIASTTSSPFFELTDGGLAARDGIQLGGFLPGSLSLAGGLLKATTAGISLSNPGLHSITTTISATNLTGHGVAVKPDGTRAYVTQGGFGAFGVDVINTATNAVLASVPVGGSPVGIAVTPDGAKVYVALEVSPFTVAVIDTATNTIAATVTHPTAGTGARGVAIAPDGRRAYVSNNSGTVVVINTVTNAVTAEITGLPPGSAAGRSVAISPDGQRAYTTTGSGGSQQLVVIDTTTNTVLTSVSMGAGGEGHVAISPDGRRVYATSGPGLFNRVTVLDTATNTVVATLITISEPDGVAISPDGTRAYVTSRTGTLSVIDTATNTVIATVSASAHAAAAAIARDGSRLYVANAGFISSVSVFDTQRASLVAVAPGSTLTQAGTAPLVELSGVGNSLSLPGGVFRATGATATVGGTLFKASDTLLTVGTPMIDLDASSLTAGALLDLTNVTLNLPNLPVVFVKRGSTLRTTVGPAVRIVGGSLTADTLMTTDGSGHTFVISGTNAATGAILDLTNTTVGFRALFSDPPTPGQDNAVTLTLAANQPLLRLAGGVGGGPAAAANTALTLTGTGEKLLELGEDLTGPVAGVGLVSTATAPFMNTLSLEGHLIDLKAVTLTATDPFVQLTRTALTQTGSDRPLIRVAPDGGTVTLTGPLALVLDSTLDLSAGFFGLQNGTLTSATTSPFVVLNPTTLTGADSFFRVGEGLGTASLALNGRLLTDLGGAINLTNTAYNTQTATVTAGSQPFGVAVARSGPRGVYIANFGGNSVTVLDPDTGATTTVPVGVNPKGIEVNPFGTRVFTANEGSNSVSVIDTTSKTVIATILVGSGPKDVAVKPDGSRGYVTNFLSGTVTVFDAGTNTIIGDPITVGSNPHDLAVRPDGLRVYVANRASDSISVIDTTSNTVVGTVGLPAGAGPVALAVTPDGSRAYVANQFNNTVSVIDLATNAVTATIAHASFAGPHGVAFSRDGSRAYVTNIAGTAVTVINVANLSVAGTVPLATGSLLGIAIDSRDDVAYVAHFTAAPAASVIDVFPGGRILDVSSGATLTSNTTSALLRFDGDTVTAGGSFVGVNGTLTLRGGLVEARNGAALGSGGSFLGVFRGTLADTAPAASTAPLLDFAGDSSAKTLAAGATLGGNVVSVSGSPFGTATLTLKRPLFAGTNTAVSSFFHFLSIFDGGSVCAAASCGGAASGAPFVTFSGGSYTGGLGGGGALLRMFSFSTQNPTSFTLGDGFLSASGGATLSVPNTSLVDVRNGATLTSTASVPFLNFSNASATAGFNLVAIGGSSTSGGASGVGAAPSVSLAGPLFRAADTGATLTFASSGAGVSAMFSIFDGGSLTKIGSGGLIELTGTGADRVVLDSARNIFAASTSAAVTAVGGTRTPPTLTLAGRLIDTTNARLESGDPTVNAFSSVFIGDGSIVTKTDTTPLLDLETTSLVTSGAALSLRRSPTAAVNSRLVLGEAHLLEATNSLIQTTNPSGGGSGAACCSAFFVGQGALLSSTGTGALIRLTNTTVNAGGDGVSGGHFFAAVSDGQFVTDTFHLTQLPSTVSLAGGLVSATDSPITALLSALRVDRSTLTAGSASSPVFALTNIADRAYSFGGDNPFGGVGFGSFFRAWACAPGSPACAGSLAADASVTFNGPLLVTTNTGAGTRTSLSTTFDFVAVERGAVVTSTTTSPFVTSTNSDVSAGIVPGVATQPFMHFIVVRDGGGAGGTAPAALSLAGSVLASNNDVFNVTAGFLEVNDGVSVPFSAAPTSITKTGTTTPVMSFTNSTVNLGPAAGGVAGTGNFIEVNDNTVMNLAGPSTGLFTLSLTTGGVAPWNVDRLVFAECGAGGAACPTGAGNPGLDTNGNTGPLVAFSGEAASPHTVALEMFKLLGLGTTAVVEEGNALTVGTDQPVRHAGPLYEGSNSAALTTGQVAAVDRALLEASAPIIRLLSGASVSSTSGDAFSLTNGGRIQTTPLASTDALISLNMATLSVTNGSLFGLSGSSLLKVLGDLVRMSNASTLNISSVANGYLLNVTGSSVATISGALFNFQGSGNTVNIANNSAPTTTIAGIPVLLANGALASQVSITNPIKNAASGAINYTNSGSLVRIDGPNAKLRVDGL